MAMAESVYKVIELVGTSKDSESLRDLRIAEISQLDLQMKNGKIDNYRARVKVSFKYEGGA
jgi:flavin-binding protein dodecin